MISYEANGLASLIESGTIHQLSEPPIRDDYAASHDYDEAYRQWLNSVTRWVSVKSSRP